MEYNFEDSVSILKRTPRIIRALVMELPAEWLHSNEGPDTWSIFDVIGHLIHGEKTDWIPRAQIILSNAGDKRFPEFDRFAMFQNSKGKTPDQLMGEFERLRSENIKTLETMPINEEVLSRTGFHPEFGEVTLKQLLATWVTHDLTHLVQIARVMAKQYKAEVGPWVPYIGVLNQ